MLTPHTPSYVHIEIDISHVRGVIDDLLPVLREGHSLILRSTVAPGTTEWVAGYIEQRRGFRVGEDLFVSHVPERIAENHFLEEIATLPCIVGGVGERSGARAAELFEAFGTEIVQTTPVQAELAKIWTNILRYTQFALPNLLMMECEQYGANVFDVIELINHDYPRGGMAAPGLTAGACLRKDFTFSEERSNAPGMLLAVSRVHETRSAVRGQGPEVAARRIAARPEDRGARTHLQARLRRRSRLALLQARAHARARAGPCGAPRPARTGGIGAARLGARGRRRRGGGHEPLGLRGTAGAPAGGHARGRPVERDGLPLGIQRSARARDRRVSRVLVTGGAGTIGSAVVRRLLREGGWTVRVSDQREAPVWMAETCELHRGDLRELDAARAAMADCTHVIHLAAIVGGIANFHRLPHTLLEVNNALYNAVFRAALEEPVERLVYVSSSMMFENATEFPTTERHVHSCPAPRSAYGFSKLAGEVYCRALHDEHGLPYTICRPFNAYGPGELPDDEPGIAHLVPDLISKVLSGQHPIEIFGSGEQTRTLTHVDDIADGIVTAMESRAGQNEDFNISASDERTIADIARIIWEACGLDPGRVRAAAPAELRGGRAAALAVGGEGERAARLGGAGRPARRHRRHGRLATRVGGVGARVDGE